MNPAQILFNAMSSMTNGLISDSTSLLLGLLVLGFLAMGFDRLMEGINSVIDARVSDRLLSAAHEAKQARDANLKGSIGWRESDITYRKLLDKSVDRKIKSMRY